MDGTGTECFDINPHIKVVHTFTQQQGNIDVGLCRAGIYAGCFAARDRVDNAEIYAINLNDLALFPFQFRPWFKSVNQQITAEAHRIDFCLGDTVG